jgi:hypothetical protein
MNEYLKKNFGYEVEGDFDTLQEARKSLQAEQLELKDNYMSAKYVENMLMIETISSLLKAHGETLSVQEDKYSDLNPTNKFGYFGGPGFYSNDGSTYTEPHYDDFDIRQHNRDNPEDKIKLNNWDDFNLKMRYHKKDGKRVQGYGGMGYNVSFHGNPKDVEAFAMKNLDAERYSGDNIPEAVQMKAVKEEQIHEEDIKWSDFVKLSKSSGQGGMDWNNFIDYVEKFYGTDGIYADFFKNHDGSEGVTKKEILKHVKILAKDENWQWGQGDTMDREKVRDMMLTARPTSRTHYRGMREEAVQEADEEKGPDHYKWKNDSQLAVALGRIESAMEALDYAIEYRSENSDKFFTGFEERAGVGDLMRIKEKLVDIHSNWEKETEYYGM